ncbi:hypothetical protein EHQ12_02715 [Leptospira gomenensis]|uniref:Uncharacterized protein n=1 Tax=Leptospira gomenensis TaxID=2484974 RepID=A0A5F1Y992_9LEPT|nr:hypothetical protein [Leptospira gomenensis]TGK32365.1 hypothetical protein EHQ17_12580 [Leptospira gomenensis]TGK43991.1 hypothetical protein EHQ12_02715 [Leptospira gomenensis]TGK48932.1 hypothetical protein EHQ07_05175 [Leptospira gomenensis]TGK54643.1 hypothetical protein EHQ13_19145 [Leptospira gomenensis]
MYSKVIYFITIFLFFSLGLHSVSYEEAYSMEKEDPIFSIPLYEELLKTSQKADVRKTAASRLFFLYEKYRKYIPAILIMSRSGKITDKKGRYPAIVSELAGGLGVGPSALVSVISGCGRTIPDPDQFLRESLSAVAVPSSDSANADITDVSDNSSKKEPESDIPYLFRILSKKENAPLYKACYAVKIKTGDYDGWEKIHAFGEANKILSPETSLALRISFTLHSGRGSAYKRIYSGGKLKSLSEEGKSDLLYLYGKFLRNLGKFDSAARYFWMSGSYFSQERAKVETAKTLLVSGRKQEACSHLSKGFSAGDESEELLQRICFKNFENERPSSDLLKAVRILNSDSSDPVYEYVLGKGSAAKTEESDQEDSADSDSRYAKLIDESLFAGEKNPTPFWDLRKKEGKGTFFFGSAPAFLCKQSRSVLFKRGLIQPQNCVPFPGFSSESILETSLFGTDQDELIFIFSNASYNQVSTRIVWEQDGKQETFQLSSLVFRKSLHRFFAEGTSQDGKYRFYSIDLKSFSAEIPEP